MGFLKKKKENNENIINEVEASSSPVIDDEDDFDVVEKPQKPTRDEFHKMAEDNLLDALNDAKEETTAPEKAVKAPSTEVKKIKFGTMIKNFMKRHIIGIRITAIILGVVLLALIGIYIYGCNTLTPGDVMGRNIYIENINVSGLTYDEALIKVKNTRLLNNRDLKLVSNGKSFIIDGVEAGLTPKVEDTVDRAMRYGKTNNIFIDGLANTLQYFFPHRVLPMANVDEAVIRTKLQEFGAQIHGELVQHKMEISDDYIICTPGHSGFSGNVDAAYNEIVKAINNENYEKIRVTLLKALPQPITFDMLTEFGEAEPQDAHYQIVNGETSVIPEICGRTFEKNQVMPLLNNIREGGETVKIPFNKIEAKIKEGDLNDQLFNSTLASYTTSYYAGGNRGRNVAIAASKIHDVVVLPGEVFSFNATVGPRSSANGFMPAEEYSNGETVIGIGGGTCQVSTTLYNAVLYADLAIVSRLNHMFAVGYAPLGQDATVSDSGVDFKFSNNTDNPIKITAVTGGGKITVSIIGTAREVERKVKIENITSYVGADRSVRSYRYVYDPNGNLLRKDDLGKSYYMSHHKEEPAPEASAAPSEQPTEQTPTVDTPVVDTPVVDTPAVDTPVVDTPVVDTPVQSPQEELPSE